MLASQFSVPCPPVPQPAASDAAVGMKRCRSSGAFSAFEPYPLGGPAAAVLASRAKRLRSLGPSAQLADAAAATQAASATSSESAGSAGGCRSSATAVTATADSTQVAAEAALAAYQARKHLQMLRRAAGLLPKLPPAAQAVLLLRLRAVARRRAAAAAALKAKPAARCAQCSCCACVEGLGRPGANCISAGSRGSSWGGSILRSSPWAWEVSLRLSPLPTCPHLPPPPAPQASHPRPSRGGPRDGPRAVHARHGLHPGWHAGR